jgi:hypothetical protein
VPKYLRGLQALLLKQSLLSDEILLSELCLDRLDFGLLPGLDSGEISLLQASELKVLRAVDADGQASNEQSSCAEPDLDRKRLRSCVELALDERMNIADDEARHERRDAGADLGVDGAVDLVKGYKRHGNYPAEGRSENSSQQVEKHADEARVRFRSLLTQEERRENKNWRNRGCAKVADQNADRR